MLNEVELITKQIGADQIDLDQLVDKIEQGYTLIKKMRGRLEQTKQKLEKLNTDALSAEDAENTSPESC